MNESFPGATARLPPDPVFRGSAEADLSFATSPPLAMVSSLLGALRRRRRLWASAAVFGVAAAIVLSVAFPPDRTATTTLFLQHASQGDATRAMATDAQLLKTRTVAQVAIDTMGLRLPSQDLVDDLRITVLTSDILQLTVAGSTEAAAVRRAAAVAEAFLTFRSQEYERQSRVEVDALGDRADEVNAELTKVNDAINTFSSRPDAKSEPGLREYGDLLSKKAMLSGQLGQLQQRIHLATVAPASSVAKSRILDPPRADERSPLRAMVVNVASGLVAGLAVGAGWVVLQELVSDKVRRPEEVAAALQAPVAIVTRRYPGFRGIRRMRFKRHLSRPQRPILRVVRKWRDVVLSGTPSKPALAVCSIGGDSEAALFVASTAREFARDGRKVVVAGLSNQSLLASIFAVAPEGTSAVQARGSLSSLRVTFPSIERQGALADGVAFRLDPAVYDADVVLILLTPATMMEAVEFPLPRGTAAAAVVRAGATNAASLRATGQMLRDRGLDLDHAVLVGADPGDQAGLANAAMSGGMGPAVVRQLPVRSGGPT